MSLLRGSWQLSEEEMLLAAVVVGRVLQPCSEMGLGSEAAGEV